MNKCECCDIGSGLFLRSIFNSKGTANTFLIIILNTIRSPKHGEALNIQTYVTLMHIMTLLKAYRIMLDVRNLLYCPII